MAKQEKEGAGASKKNRRHRSTDDLELIKLILDENEALKERVMRLLERALGKPTGR